MACAMLRAYYDATMGFGHRKMLCARSRVLSLLPLTSMGCLLLVGAAMLLGGCYDSVIVPPKPEELTERVDTRKIDAIEKVDLLFMIDNSRSMEEEQALLLIEIERVIRAFVTGDIDGDGLEEFPPIDDIHAGVVTANMGNPTSNPTFGSCGFNDLGDDGRLGVVSGSSRFSDGNFAELAPGEPSAPFIERVRAMARVGAEGCGVERQIEALTKAVTRSDQVIFGDEFGRRETGGQGDRFNQGFLRDDALLVTIVVTDEEDCSGTGNVYPFDNLGEPDTNVRCQRCADPNDPRCLLDPVELYVNALIGDEGVKAPSFFVFGAIVGLPDLPGTSPTDFDRWLDPASHPFGEINGDEYNARFPGGFVPSELIVPAPICSRRDPDNPEFFATVAGTGRRYAEFAKAISARGARAGVYSICEPSFEEPIANILADVAETLSGRCLPNALESDEAGLVDCNVEVTLPTGITSCAGRPGLNPIIQRGENGRVVCEAIQRTRPAEGGDPTEAGWFYKENPGPICPPSKQQRIVFTDENEGENTKSVPEDSRITIECAGFKDIPRDIDVGTFCGNDPDLCLQAADSVAGYLEGATSLQGDYAYRLRCHRPSNTCQAVCSVGTGSAECRDDEICFRRGNAEISFVQPLPDNLSGETIGLCLKDPNLNR